MKQYTYKVFYDLGHSRVMRNVNVKASGTLDAQRQASKRIIKLGGTNVYACISGDSKHYI